jgi:hypothetical protein
MHCGAGVPDGEGVDVNVAVVEGVGVVERDAVEVDVGVAEVDAPVDKVADKGVVVGERVAVEDIVGGGLKTTLAITPCRTTLLSDHHLTVIVFPVVVHEPMVLPVRDATRVGEPVVGPLCRLTKSQQDSRSTKVVVKVMVHPTGAVNVFWQFALFI